MDFFQTPQFKALLAILGVSLLVAVLDSIRRRQVRSRLDKCTVLVETRESTIPKTAAPQAALETPSKTIAPIEPCAMVSPGVRINAPTLPFAALLPLPQPSPRLLGHAAPLKAYGFVLK
jgi:hypothetical protein